MPDLIQQLEMIAKRPWMYAGGPWVPSVDGSLQRFYRIQGVLTGLRIGCDLAGIQYSLEDYISAAEARGWDPRGAVGVEDDFRRKGLPEEDMIDELLAVEMAAYQRVLGRLVAKQDASTGPLHTRDTSTPAEQADPH